MIYVSVIHVSVSLSQYMCLCACLIWVISIAMFFLFPESFTESLLARHCQKTNLLTFLGSSFFTPNISLAPGVDCSRKASAASVDIATEAFSKYFALKES